MHLVWKRPDGFYGASPEDFTIFRVDGEVGLWLHRKDKDTYPFRIAGGWQETEASRRLNNLVNLLPEQEAATADFLVNIYNRSMSEQAIIFWQEINQWLEELSQKIKGDQWEISLIDQVLQIVKDRHRNVKDLFLEKVSVQ